MNRMGWVGSLYIGALVGRIAEKIIKADQSLHMNIILGIIGALTLNAVFFAIVDTTPGGWIGQLIVAAVGARLLIVVVHLLRRKT